MSQSGIPVGPEVLPPKRRGNGFAWASLVLGILGCIPEITGLLAIVFGILGLRRARDPNTGGRGLAIAGLTLGIVSVVLWSIAIAFTASLWSGSSQPRAVVRQYLADVSSGNVSAAMNASTPAVTPAGLQSLRKVIAPLGPLQNVHFYGVNLSVHNGTSHCGLNGRADFAHGNAIFSATLVRQGGPWKVNSLRVTPQ